MKADFGLASERLSATAYVLDVEGELDLYTSPRLRSSVGELLARGAHTLVLDLSETTFMDSAALHVLLDARKRLRSAGGELVVVAPPGPVRRILAVTGLDGLVRLCLSRSAAVDALAPLGGSLDEAELGDAAAAPAA